MISPRLIILGMRNISHKLVEKIKTQVSSSITIFRKLCCLRDNVEYMVESERSQMTIQDGAETVRCASWIPQATNTHSEYVILVFSYSNDSGTNAPPCYAICKLSVLFILKNADIKIYPIYKWYKIGRKCMLMCLGKKALGSPYIRWRVVWTRAPTPCWPSWGATSPPAIKETPPWVHYRTHKGSPVVTILRHINPLHTLQSHLLNIHFNIIVYLRLYFKSISYFQVSLPNPTSIYLLSSTCQMPCPSHPPFLWV